jgi:glycerol-3-phosphate dehydrogenase
MAQVLSDAGNDVLLWGRSADVIAEINGAHTILSICLLILFPKTLRPLQILRKLSIFQIPTS